MLKLPRLAVAVAAAMASLGSAGVVSLVTATPSGAAQPACTDTWVGPTTGTTNWNASASDWSLSGGGNAFPGSSDVVCIKAPGTYTVDLTAPFGTSINTLELGGGATGTQTLKVSGSSNDSLLSLGAASTVNKHGVLALAPTSTGDVQISGASSLTVGSGGVLSTITGGAGSQPAYFSVPVTNQAGGRVTIGAASTLQESDTLTTNAGTLTVASGADLAVSNGSSFTNTGSLAVAGTLSDDNGIFTESGGAETGNPVTFTGGESTLADSAGTGAFSFVTDGTLTGTIPSGQTVTVSGASTNVVVGLPSAVTDDGVLALAPTSTGYSQISGASSLTVGSGGVLSTVAGGAGSQPAYISAPVTNQAGGTVTIGAASTVLQAATPTTNAGTLTVASGADLAVANSSAFTNTGSLAVAGTLNSGNGTFTESGGAETGNPVMITGGTLADSAGTGAFTVLANTFLTGTIPSGQTVTVSGASTSVVVSLNSAVTDDGVLALAPTSAGYARIDGGSNNENSLTVGSGGVLSTVAGGAGSQPAYIDAPGTNQAGGTITIGAAESYQDDDNLITNAGTFQVTKSGEYTIPDGSGSELYGTSGTIGVTVNGAHGTGGIGGLMVVSGSTLAVSTVGSPAVGSTFAPIAESQESHDGDVAFSALDCGRYACTVSYPSPPANELMLTLEAPFTTSPTPFSPHKDIPTGAVQVASIGSAANGTGTYSATVNWGDGTATQAATVDITGSTGTVTGPTHTYARSGTFRVTVSVANTDGNTLITTETVSVPALAITSVSPTSGPTAGSTTVTITGSGFTGATKVTFGSSAAKSFTVVSDTEITAVSPSHAAGTVGIKVTTPGGISAKVTADQYTYM